MIPVHLSLMPIQLPEVPVDLPVHLTDRLALLAKLPVEVLSFRIRGPDGQPQGTDGHHRCDKAFHGASSFLGLSDGNGVACETQASHADDASRSPHCRHFTCIRIAKGSNRSS
jgi:hypothetical protein